MNISADSSETRRRWIKRGIFSLVAAGSIWFGLQYWFLASVAKSENKLLETARNTVGAIDQESMDLEFPDRGADPDSLKLNRRMLALGTSLPLELSETEIKALDEKYQEWRDAGLFAFLEDVRPDPSGNAPELPVELNALLEFHQEDLAAIELWLVGNQGFALPRNWRNDYPFPQNPTGLIKMQRILAAEMVRADQAGDSGAGSRAYLAAVLLNKSIEDQANLLSQLVFIANLKTQNTALKTIANDPELYLHLQNKFPQSPNLLLGARSEIAWLYEKVKSGDAKAYVNALSKMDPDEENFLWEWGHQYEFTLRNFSRVLEPRLRELDHALKVGPCITHAETESLMSKTPPFKWSNSPFVSITTPTFNTAVAKNAEALRNQTLIRRLLEFRVALNQTESSPGSQQELDQWVETVGLSQAGPCGPETFQYEWLGEATFRVSIPRKGLARHPKWPFVDKIDFTHKRSD